MPSPADSTTQTAATPHPVGTAQDDRGMLFRWSPRAPGAPAQGVSLLDRVLSARGIVGEQAAGAYLHPSLGHLHDPSLIPGLDRAAERILAALERGERIAIYGDYDADGATATAILFHTMTAIRPQAAPGAESEGQIVCYVPHRIDEGYGLHEDAIASLAEDGCTLIVSVDCGITAVGPAAVARKLGVDLIITDHHNPPANEAELPDAFAIVHPRAPGSAYPFEGLCGAGVAYKLAWRMCTMKSGSAKVEPGLRALLIELLALAALGSVADVVPLTDENRAIAKFGLGRIQGSPLGGLRALVEACDLANEKVKADDVAFRLAPRINACGRLGHARDTVELLTTASGERAEALAAQLARQNDQRRRVEKAIFDQACELAEASGMTGDSRRAIVLAHEDWHPGVVGIVCSRLVERFARPVILMQRAGELTGGSGRSIDGFSLHAALTDCADLLAGYGGHDMAAGLRLQTSNLETFTERFIERTNAELAPHDLVRTTRYDAEATLGELTIDSINELARMEPFGRDNPPVQVRLRGLRVSVLPRFFGAAGDHARLTVTDGRQTVQLLGWRWAERVQGISPGAMIEAIVTPGLNRWNGICRVEPILVDLRPA